MDTLTLSSRMSFELNVIPTSNIIMTEWFVLGVDLRVGTQKDMCLKERGHVEYILNPKKRFEILWSRDFKCSKII